MRTSVTLYGLLRLKVLPEAKGKVELEMPEGSTIEQVISQLALPGHLVVSVNGRLARDRSVLLNDGDVLLCFNPAGGGQPTIPYCVERIRT